MIRIENLSYSFPQKDLFNNISFTIEKDNHCAFIGTSGSGKSTLIKILTNPDNYMFDGKLEIEDKLTIGYISQSFDLEAYKDMTVFEFVALDFINYQEKINKLCKEMETSSDLEDLLIEYQSTIDAYDSIGGDSYESLINKKLGLVNLSKQKDLLINKLSGGEFKLVQIIKEMLKRPELLIMDEPDVFLDFENIISLKDLINYHKGMLLVITHNRYLLNNCFNKIIHLENTELQEFYGDYTEYNYSLLQKKIELQELSVADDLEIERQQKIVDRQRYLSTVFIDAKRGNSLKSRKSLLERLEKSKIKAPFVNISQPKIKFNNNFYIEETVALKVSDFNISFEELLLENVEFEIKSNEKVALIGANGTGKTTLFREIYKNHHDSITINPDLKISYLSQINSEMFDENDTILNQFLDLGFKTNDEVFDYLSDFGFEKETILGNTLKLSGGEKNLLGLAKVTFEGSNFLLLDEPTSHLDIYSQVALEKALKNYNGSVLMVSHDYYSIINSVDYVLLIENKTIRKMTVKKFKRLIHANHFNKDYLLIEERKKALELEISNSLQDKNFEKAKLLSIELAEVINDLQSNN